MDKIAPMAASFRRKPSMCEESKDPPLALAENDGCVMETYGNLHGLVWIFVYRLLYIYRYNITYICIYI